MVFDNQKKQKIIFSMRVLFCVLLVTIWIMWLTRMPQRTEDKKQETIEVQEIPSVTPKLKVARQMQQKLSIVTHHLTSNDLPLFAELNFKGKEGKENKKIETNNVETPIFMTVPPEEAPLRKKIHVDKKRLLSINKIESWLPKYVTETKKLALDEIASKIELVGLISSTSGKSAAIIKDNSNNKIEILKNQEEYEGLQLLEIKNDEIVLGNQSLDKRYVKKIIPNN